MRPKGEDGMANSVDPGQTDPRSCLIWVYTVSTDLSIRKLRINTAINRILWSQGTHLTTKI